MESLQGNTTVDYLLTDPENIIDDIPNEYKLKPVYKKDPTNGNPFHQDAYEPLQMLGKGGFSRVYLVRKKNDGMIYAMKIISKKYSAKWGGELVKREFQLMKEVSHPLIVNVIYVFPTETTYNFVIEYCPGGTLYQRLRSRKKFSVKRSLIYFAEMLSVMKYLHTHDVLFRDLKVLLSSNWVFKG